MDDLDIFHECMDCGSVHVKGEIQQNTTAEYVRRVEDKNERLEKEKAALIKTLYIIADPVKYLKSEGEKRGLIIQAKKFAKEIQNINKS